MFSVAYCRGVISCTHKLSSGSVVSVVKASSHFSVSNSRRRNAKQFGDVMLGNSIGGLESIMHPPVDSTLSRTHSVGSVTDAFLDSEANRLLAVQPGNPASEESVSKVGSSNSLAWTGTEDDYSKKIKIALALSWIVNILLFVSKLVAFIISNSMAVLASLADSFVDLASQAVISYADHKIRRHDNRFPIGKTRLETVGVILCACIMTLSSFEVVRTSSASLYSGLFEGVLPDLEVGFLVFAILGVATALKLPLYLYCVALQSRSDIMMALAEDHLNDIMSNTGAIATAAIAGAFQKAWWVDPVGAIAISLFIIYRWSAITKSQVDKIVGMGAPQEFVDRAGELCSLHHPQLTVDCIRAYHFGARYIVELEVILPRDWTVVESHDVALDLQHKVEGLPEVERAFVHVDYQGRDEPEHKVERNLLQGASDLYLPHSSVQPLTGGPNLV